MTFARIIRANPAAEAAPVVALGPRPATWRRIAREEVDARRSAERIVAQAQADAQEILVKARDSAALAASRAAHEAACAAQADMAAQWLALRQKEQQETDGRGDRVVALAVVLAERLLGAALALDPARISELARGVLAEARGARRAVVDAHPADVEALRQGLRGAGLEAESVEVRADGALARGELRLHTDVGMIDARLASRFERLASALHDALK
jgi:flagellar biosynthesis/type III secretory pathway protein FliH